MGVRQAAQRRRLVEQARGQHLHHAGVDAGVQLVAGQVQADDAVRRGRRIVPRARHPVRMATASARR